MNKLKEVFSHSEAAAKEVQKMCEQAIQELIEKKYCIVCKHYSYDPWVPGYIAYEGDCDLGAYRVFQLAYGWREMRGLGG